MFFVSVVVLFLRLITFCIVLWVSFVCISDFVLLWCVVLCALCVPAKVPFFARFFVPTVNTLPHVPVLLGVRGASGDGVEPGGHNSATDSRGRGELFACLLN